MKKTSIIQAACLIICCAAFPACAQPVTDDNISSYPASNQRSAGPNEPDARSGNSASSYRQPDGNMPVNGTGNNQPVVVFDGSNPGVPGNPDVDITQTSGGASILYPVAPVRR